MKGNSENRHTAHINIIHKEGSCVICILMIFLKWKKEFKMSASQIDKLDLKPEAKYSLDNLEKSTSFRAFKPEH